jgi:hypothetical protein
LADTLIVVTNPGTVPMKAWIEVFDKHGVAVGQQTFYNGGTPITQINVNGYGWITLGMIVNRTTHDPWNFPGGEKFAFKIYTDITMTPIVEIKQVIYDGLQSAPPGEAIWQASAIRTWAEAALGGLKGPGVTKAPLKYRW